MTTSPVLSVVMPVFNEIDLLRSVVDGLVRGVGAITPSFEIVLSENGSTDGSVALADDLARELPSVRVVHSPVADYGFALQRGLLAARGEFMANLSVDFVDLVFLREGMRRIVDLDVVLGSKYLNPDSDRRPFLRRVPGLAFNMLAQRALRLPYLDTHGLKVFRRSAVEATVRRCIHGGAMFDNELVVRCSRQQLRIVEIPVSVVEVRPSRTRNLGLAVRSLADLARLVVNVDRDS